MLKFLLITFLIIFIVVRLGGLIFRTIFWVLGARAGNRNMYKQPYQPGQGQAQRPNSHKAGDIHIEYVPEKEAQKKKSAFDGGEYVDYEEVK